MTTQEAAQGRGGLMGERIADGFDAWALAAKREWLLDPQDDCERLQRIVAREAWEEATERATAAIAAARGDAQPVAWQDPVYTGVFSLAEPQRPHAYRPLYASPQAAAAISDERIQQLQSTRDAIPAGGDHPHRQWNDIYRDGMRDGLSKAIEILTTAQQAAAEGRA